MFSFEFWKPYLWRIVSTFLGLVVAILFMTLGFWRTFLMLVLCGVGFYMGRLKDKRLKLPEWFLFWQDRF